MPFAGDGAARSHVFLGVAALHKNWRELTPDVLAPVAAILIAVAAVKLAAGYGVVRGVH